MNREDFLKNLWRWKLDLEEQKPLKYNISELKESRTNNKWNKKYGKQMNK